MELGPLPNGWECKYDSRTRRNYFINYVNKTTTWDDPRVKSQATAPPPYQDPSADLITLQPQLHGTPDHRNIYPSYPAHYHPQHAFQMPNPYMQEILRQDASSFRPSPIPGRAHTAPLMGSFAIGHHVSSKMQETSFINPSTTEQSVARISAMFPTVAETHIRALLIKYHSRDAVVISALQVEKNPITTPGPFSTPPLARHIIIPSPVPPPNYHSTPPSGLRDCSSTPPPSLYSYGFGTGGGTLTGSPASSSYLGSPAFRHSPRPHSSPKMKLRYMKSLFPRADETIILDTLYNVENNVQAATNQLQAMGFDKRDTPSRAGTPLSKVQEIDKKNKEEETKEQKVASFVPPARFRSVEEKHEMRDRLKKIHPDLVDHLIFMALESVDYDESRASHILNLMIKEENSPKCTQPKSASSERPTSKSENAEVLSVETKTTVEADVIVSENSKATSSPQADGSSMTENLDTTKEDVSVHDCKPCERKPPNHSTIADGLPGEKTCGKKIRSKKDVPKVSRGTSTTEDKEYRSPLRLTSVGPNLSLHFGPSDDLLLEDYVTWKGPMARARRQTCNAHGPNKALLSSRAYVAKGPSREMCKGSKAGLARGSVYSHLATSNAIDHIGEGESRGK